MTPADHAALTARAGLCRLLLTHGVDFVVIDGMAIQAHGLAHVTSDLDLLCRDTPANLERLGRALAEAGSHARGRPDVRFLFPDDVAELVAPNVFAFDTRYGSVDVMKRAPNAWDFTAIRHRAELLTIGDVVIPVAHLDDLIAMKRFADRPNDRAVLPDLLRLRRARRAARTKGQGSDD